MSAGCVRLYAPDHDLNSSFFAIAVAIALARVGLRNGCKTELATWSRGAELPKNRKQMACNYSSTRLQSRRNQMAGRVLYLLLPCMVIMMVL
jgi:hypothetical protein